MLEWVGAVSREITNQGLAVVLIVAGLFFTWQAGRWLAPHVNHLIEFVGGVVRSVAQSHNQYLERTGAAIENIAKIAAELMEQNKILLERTGTIGHLLDRLHEKGGCRFSPLTCPLDAKPEPENVAVADRTS